MGKDAALETIVKIKKYEPDTNIIREFNAISLLCIGKKREIGESQKDCRRVAAIKRKHAPDWRNTYQIAAQ